MKKDVFFRFGLWKLIYGIFFPAIVCPVLQSIFTIRWRLSLEKHLFFRISWRFFLALFLWFYFLWGTNWILYQALPLYRKFVFNEISTVISREIWYYYKWLSGCDEGLLFLVYWNIKYNVKYYELNFIYLFIYRSHVPKIEWSTPPHIKKSNNRPMDH